MTAYLTFYPLGNADTTLVKLANSELILFDFANMRNANDPNDKRIDLPAALNSELDDADQSSFRVVVFTHLDEDHIKGSKDYFWFEYAAKYQGDGRVKIDELWVPAGAITETGVDADAWVIRQEARHRLIKGEGIKVLSRPETLKSFLEENGLTIDERRDCIVDAGQLIPGFKKSESEAVEFFVHSPFAWRTDAGLVDRNAGSIVVQATFKEGTRESCALLGSDIEYETLSEIVKTTKKHKNEDRLHWDILKLFHHCSYKSLGPEKGDDITEPVEDVKWLFEELARQKEIIVSPSKPIPSKGTKEDEDVQPPHRQAANYYKEIIKDSQGRFMVTMETPSTLFPKAIRLTVTTAGVAVVSSIVATAANTSTSRTTRAG